MSERIRNTVIKKAERVKPFCLKHRYSLLFTAGVLSALPFVFGELFFLPFFTLGVYYLYMASCSDKPFRMSFAFFFGYYFAEYHWFTSLYPIELFGLGAFESVLVILLLWSGIAAIHTLISSLIMAQLNRISNKNVIRPFAGAALWVIAEFIISAGGFGFPWASMALLQSGFLWQIQTISLFGGYFITLVVCICSFCTAEWIKNGKRFMPYVALSVYVVNLVAGIIIYYVPRNIESTYKAAVVQGNIGTNEKWSKENLTEIFDTYVRMTREAASEDGVKLVLLPESAIPVYFVENGAVHKAFADAAAEYDVTVMFGSLYYESGNFYNSVFAVFPDGTVSNRYDKQKLVPVIEGLPYDDTVHYTDFLNMLPFFRNVDFYKGIYTNGTESSVITLPDGTKAAPEVCFDSAFSSVAVNGARNGATLLAVVSNDSWYHDGEELYQHRNIAALRSVETGRYTVRAANTGISCIIDDKGRIIAQTEPLTESIIYADAASISDKTLYTTLGDVPLYVCELFVAALTLVFVYNTLKNKKLKSFASK